MSDQQLAVQHSQSKPSALAVMSSRFSVEPSKLLATLKATCFKGATDDELLALVVVANEYGLNPLCKEIYAFPAKGGGIVPVVSIDGWINRMNSHTQFDGIEFADAFSQDGKISSVTATIHRKDRTRPVKVTEYLSECYRNTDPWNKCPSRMLRHKALMQGVRVAFGFAGVHDEDDAVTIAEARVREIPKAQLSDTPTTETTVLPPEKKEKRKPAEKPEPAKEPAPADTAAETDADRIKAKLVEAGFTEDLLVKMAIHMQLTNAKATAIDEIPAKRQADILADWDTAVSTMEAIRAKEAQA